jgi:hypothetical protein
MKKLAASVVALVFAILVGGALLHAAASATFVPVNGPKQAGTLIYGRGDNNIVDLRFHLSVGGQDKSWGMDEIAAVDFGGTPSPAELAALPNDDAVGVMVMRSGTTVKGALHNIIGGDIVQWIPEGGRRTNYPIGDVSRLYLKPKAARAAYARR